MLTLPIIDRLCREATPKVSLERRRCLRSRFNKNRCVRCLEACPSGAVALRGNQITLDPEKCTDCRQCTAVCPNDAYRGGVDLLSLLKETAAKPVVLISCPKGVLSHEGITVPCIGMFSEAMLAAMNMVTQEQCHIDISQCQHCLNSHCLPAFQEKITSLGTRLLQEACEIRLTCHTGNLPALPVTAKDERRSFLRRFQKNITKLSKDTFSSRDAGRPCAPPGHEKKPPEDITALLHALSAAPTERTREKKVLAAYFPSLSINGQCDLCPLCTAMCPTGALQREKTEGERSLTFTSARCSGCGLCISFCRKKALTLTGGHSGDPAITQHLTTN